jgi:hypothetical protein
MMIVAVIVVVVVVVVGRITFFRIEFCYWEYHPPVSF